MLLLGSCRTFVISKTTSPKRGNRRNTTWSNRLSSFARNRVKFNGVITLGLNVARHEREHQHIYESMRKMICDDVEPALRTLERYFTNPVTMSTAQIQVGVLLSIQQQAKTTIQYAIIILIKQLFKEKHINEINFSITMICIDIDMSNSTHMN